MQYIVVKNLKKSVNYGKSPAEYMQYPVTLL
jgi:hypothetical protein